MTDYEHEDMHEINIKDVSNGPSFYVQSNPLSAVNASSFNGEIQFAFNNGRMCMVPNESYLAVQLKCNSTLTATPATLNLLGTAASSGTNAVFASSPIASLFSQMRIEYQGTTQIINHPEIVDAALKACFESRNFCETTLSDSNNYLMPYSGVYGSTTTLSTLSEFPKTAQLGFNYVNQNWLSLKIPFGIFGSLALIPKNSEIRMSLTVDPNWRNKIITNVANTVTCVPYGTTAAATNIYLDVQKMCFFRYMIQVPTIEPQLYRIPVMDTYVSTRVMSESGSDSLQFTIPSNTSKIIIGGTYANFGAYAGYCPTDFSGVMDDLKNSSLTCGLKYLNKIVVTYDGQQYLNNNNLGYTETFMNGAAYKEFMHQTGAHHSAAGSLFDYNKWNFNKMFCIKVNKKEATVPTDLSVELAFESGKGTNTLLFVICLCDALIEVDIQENELLGHAELKKIV